MKPKKKAVNYADIKPEPASKVKEDAGLAHEVGAFEAKTHLSAILAKVANGHTFYVTKRGTRIAEIRPIAKQSGERKLGLWKGRISMAEDFNAPLDDFADYM